MAKAKITNETVTVAANNNLTYGKGVSVDFTALPPNVILWLAQRTFSHIMGNEANAALKAAVGRKDNPLVIEEDGEDNGASEDFLADWRAKKLAALIEGKIGLRATGPRAKGLERYMMEVAREQVEAKIKALPTEKRKAFTAAIITERVAEYRAKAEAAIKPEAERRMAYDQGSGTDTNLDSILGL